MSDAHDPGSLELPTTQFEVALNLLREGHRVSRMGWNGKGQFIEMQVPDENSKMSLPYLYITTVQGDRVPWLASQTDLLADDWCLYYHQGEFETRA